MTHNSFSCVFISVLYMFRTAMCPSSGEFIVSIRHLVYVTLYRCPFGVQVWTILVVEREGFYLTTPSKANIILV